VRVLYLAHRVPYPPNKGEKIRAYHHLRHLATLADVHLLAFADRPEDEPWRSVLGQHCRSVELVRLRPRSGVARGVLSLLRGHSLSEGYFGDAAMWRAVRRTVTAHPFDVVWASSLPMAQYLSLVTASRRIVDFVDVDSEKWWQFAGHARVPLRWAYAIESRRLRRFEKQISATAERVLFASDAEAALFQSFVPAGVPVQVIPNGVDTALFHPQHAPATPRGAKMLFVGTLDYRPNVDAVLFFVREVLPLVRAAVPAARFTAVGHRPARRLVRSMRSVHDGVEIAGSVADVRPYFAATDVFVAPLRLGRGVQNKVLEAMAMGVPVIATPLAVEGLAVQDRVHVLVAETSRQLAAAVIELLRDAELCRRLADNALRLVRDEYRWQRAERAIDACLQSRSAVARRATRGVSGRHHRRTRRADHGRERR